MKLEEFLKVMNEIALKVEKANDSPIYGWGLNWPKPEDADWFEVVEIGPRQGCTNPRCSHFSHDAAAPDYAWLPKEGIKLILLGGETGEGWSYRYVAATNGTEVRFYEVGGSFHYHKKCRRITIDKLPAHIVKKLNDKIKEILKGEMSHDSN